MSKLESTKKMVRSVLLSCKEGVPATRLQSDYVSLTQSKIQFQKLGFDSLHEFVLSMPEVVRVSQSHGEITYHAVADESTKHIQTMVAKQKVGKRKKKSTTYKCKKPYQKFNTGAKHLHSATKNTNTAKGVKSAVPTRLSLRPQPAKAQTDAKPKAALTPIKVTVQDQRRSCRIGPQQKESKPWVSKFLSSNNAATQLSIKSVIRNRIKTILGLNPAGVFSNNLGTIYLTTYGCQLPDSVVYALESGAISDLAKVEKLTSGIREKFVLYPVKGEHSQKQESGSDGPKDEKFVINSSSNKMTVSDVVKNCIKTLVQKYNRGISSHDFKSEYASTFGCEISDSIIYGLECGQIANVVEVRTQKTGNRERVIFYPAGSDASSRSELRKKDDVIIDNVVKVRIRCILQACPDGVKLSDLEKMYKDAFEERLHPGIHDAIKKGGLKELASIKKIAPDGDLYMLLANEISAPDNRPKYPAISSTVPSKVELVKRLDPESEHDVLITRIESCNKFHVRLLSSSEDMQFIRDCTDDITNYGTLPSLDPGTEVVSSIAVAKRGRILAGGGNRARVYHMDYGNIQVMNKWNLAAMTEELKTIPELAILCRLRKPGRQNNWSEKASWKFLQLCADKKGTIKVQSVKTETMNGKREEIHIVDLCIGSLNINSRLTREEECARSGKVVSVEEKQLKDFTNQSEVCTSQNLTPSMGIPQSPTITIKTEPMCSILAEENKKARQKDMNAFGGQRENTHFPKTAHDFFQDPFFPSSTSLGKVVQADGRESLTKQKNGSYIPPVPEVRVKVEVPFEEETPSEGFQYGISSNENNPYKGRDGCAQFRNADNKFDREVILSEVEQATFERLPKSVVCMIPPVPLPHPVAEFGKLTRVMIARIISPGMFYMVLSERIPFRDALTSRMNNHYGTALAFRKSDLQGKGPLYAAPCRVDGVRNWSRVTIQNVASNFACVLLIDYGILDCVPLEWIRCLDGEFASTPLCAVIGRLAGIKPKDASRIAPATKLFENFVLGRELVAHVLEIRVIRSCLILNVCLYVDYDNGSGGCVNDLMVDDWGVADYVAEI